MYSGVIPCTPMFALTRVAGFSRPANVQHLTSVPLGSLKKSTRISFVSVSRNTSPWNWNEEELPLTPVLYRTMNLWFVAGDRFCVTLGMLSPSDQRSCVVPEGTEIES